MPWPFSYTIPVDDGAAPNPFYGSARSRFASPVSERSPKRAIRWLASARRMRRAEISVAVLCTPCTWRKFSHFVSTIALHRFGGHIAFQTRIALPSMNAWATASTTFQAPIP